ncbi:MAG: hypothetical protein ACI39G_01405 [Pseudoramibacter sp.]
MIENLSAPGELEQWSEGCVEALQDGDFTRVRVRNHRRLILAEYGADDILIELSPKGADRVYLHIESTSGEVLKWFKSCVTEVMLNVWPNQRQQAAAPQTAGSRSAAGTDGQTAFEKAYQKAHAERQQATEEEAAYEDAEKTRVVPDAWEDDPEATRIAPASFLHPQRDEGETYDSPFEDEPAEDNPYDAYDDGADEDYDDYGEEADNPYTDGAYDDGAYEEAYPEEYEEEYPDDAGAYGYDGDDGYDEGYDDDYDAEYGGDENDVYDDGYADEEAEPATFKEKWEALTEKTWFLILMLALFPPLGLYLIWHYKRFSGGKRVLATVLGIAYFLFIWLGFIGVNTGINSQTFTSLKNKQQQSSGQNVQNTPDTSSDTSTDTSSDTSSTSTDQSTSDQSANASQSGTVLEQAVDQLNNWVSSIIP